MTGSESMVSDKTAMDNKIQYRVVIFIVLKCIDFVKNKTAKV